MWSITLAAVLVLCVPGSKAAEETECPFLAGPWQNEIAQAEENLGISITDLADGNIFETLNASTIVEKCKQENNADIFKWLQIIGEHINRCRYDDTKPRLDAFNIKGLKKAFEFICKNATNLKVIEDKSTCVEENRDAIMKCHKDGMAKATDKDIMYQKCSIHRMHAYCAKKVLKEKCGKKIAFIKEKAAKLAFPPTCDCKFDTKRKTFTVARDKDCVKDKDCWSHPVEGRLLESQMQNDILFGARNIKMLEDLCAKGESQDAKPKIVGLLGTCFDRGSLCTYPVQKYKLMLINFEGLKTAAGMMCEKIDVFKNDKECVEKEIEKTKICIDNAVKNITADLTAAGEQDNMKQVICRKHKEFVDCAQQHFGKCSSSVLDIVKKIVAEREPRMCNCENVGYDPASGGSDVIRSSSIMSGVLIILGFLLTKYLS
ncbi:uncharacterized protein LOC135501353 [Lineus longissimus]|uniref:uncharacterized protein LOC135501353 n=1 Tax=Lineus longissimus TaxID=88925 RepID=UPI002B4DE262